MKISIVRSYNILKLNIFIESRHLEAARRERTKEREGERERGREGARCAARVGSANSVQSMGADDDDYAARCFSAMTRCGMSEAEAKRASGNAKLRQNVVEVFEVDAGLGTSGDPQPKQVGTALYMLATKFPSSAASIAPERRRTVARYCVDSRIKTSAQVEAAIMYMKALADDAAIDLPAFEGTCGVGVEVGDAELAETLASLFSENEARLKEERYKYYGPLLAKVREHARLKWSDGRALKERFDALVIDAIGEKTEADMAKPKKEKKIKQPAGSAAGTAAAAEAEGPVETFAQFPRPDENTRIHTEIRYSGGGPIVPMKNSIETLQRHLQETGGRVITRFPPEPNGYLHIGHAKACYIDFGLAEARGGSTVLRYDDTNPTAEKMEYITHIQDIVSWLGWKWERVTYSSDYFQELFNLAVKLIERGKAYVCHQTAGEIKEFREQQRESPWRNRSVEENLHLFEEMRKGLWGEGTATLRMKGDMKNDNANMMDLIAYRIKFAEHPHVGDAWCIYPSYDFTHCVVDSIENVTHSLCTVEFEVRRASYYWLLDALDLYQPYVWEYSRLNICHNVLSKRKLNQLVTDKHVDGWDDPRLLTLSGLRRRGCTAKGINNFCRALGVSRNENLIPLHILEHHVRSDLNDSAQRAMAVLRPLRMVITNMAEDHHEFVMASKWPNRRGAEEPYELPLTRVVYIDRDDFREQDSKGYYGLAPGKSVMLRYAYPVHCTDVVRSASGDVIELRCTYDPQRSTKPKGVLHWVAEPKPGTEPLRGGVRLYSELFKTADVSTVDDWLGDLNPESLVEFADVMLSPQLKHAKPLESYQFERVGYFCLDPGSMGTSLVFNRTVTLKETESTQAARK